MRTVLYVTHGTVLSPQIPFMVDGPNEYKDAWCIGPYSIDCPSVYVHAKPTAQLRTGALDLYVAL